MNSPLLEPIALIAYGLALVSWFAVKAGNKFYIYTSIISLCGYILITSPLLANTLLSILESDVNSEYCDSEIPQVIVVLGGGTSGIARSVHEIERLHIDSYRRAIGAVKLATQNINLPILISGGGDGEITVANIMSELMINHGIAINRIIIENKSKSTADNGFRVAKILKKLDVSSIYLVTSAVHMPRASSVFLKLNLQVCQYSVDRQRVENLKWLFSLIPQISSLHKTTDAYHEIMGLIWYYITNKI